MPVKPRNPSDGDPKRRDIDGKVLDWMQESNPRDDEARFDTLSRAIFEFQFDHCAPYERFCRARNVVPGDVSHWSEIPAVPTGAFKEAPLHSFPTSLVRGVFRTSGTSTDRPGQLHLDTYALYEASLLPSIKRHLFPEIDLNPSLYENANRFAIRALAPSPAAAPHSSLSHMFGCAIESFGSPASGYDSDGKSLQAEPLLERLRKFALDGTAVTLCGASFAFVHLLEAMGEGTDEALRIELPAGSRIMDTGGFKGRSRVIEPDELYRALEYHLGIPAHHIVNQYGMTELGSQFYDSNLLELLDQDPAGPRRKLGPPWARVRIVDPESGLEAKTGEPGMIVVHDLANTGSIAAIETADLGRRVLGYGDTADEGFEVLGRSAGAEERGCSIAADSMWLGDER